MRSVLVVLLLALGLPGCAQRPAADASTPPTGHAPLDLDTSGSSCKEVFLGVLVDPAHARAFLPPGFEPSPAARALASINAVLCDASRLGTQGSGDTELVVAVAPPTVRGADVAPAERNVYLVHHYAAYPDFAQRMAGTGFGISPVVIETRFSETPDGRAITGQATLRDDAGTLAQFAVTAVPNAPDSATANQFQVTPHGLVVRELAWADAPLAAGGATCTIRAGSLLADLFGGTDCARLQTIGVIMGPVDFESRVRFEPGASVRSAP